MALFKKMASADKKSPQLTKIKLKVGNNIVTQSDSDASAETNSLSAESAPEQIAGLNHNAHTVKRRKKTKTGLRMGNYGRVERWAAI